MTLRTDLKSKGFTLIEMAIVLAVIGAVAVGGIGLMRTMQEGNRVNETRTDFQVLHHALTAYAARYGRLPTEAEFSATPPILVEEGLVPLNALTDGWLNPIQYHVNGLDSADTLLCSGLEGFDPSANAVNLRRISSSPSSPVAYVLASTGADGVPQYQGASFYTSEGPASGTGAFDDLVTGRGPLDILRDMGCRVEIQRTGTPEDEEDPIPEGGAPGLAGQIDFFRKAMQQTGAGPGAYDGFTGTVNNTNERSFLPELNADTGEVRFTDTRSLNGGQQNQDHRSCLWAQHALRLKDSVIRTYFEASFQLDTGNGSRGDGVVFALLPWELSTRASAYQNIQRCGSGGGSLGFASQNHSNTGMDNLYATSEFSGNPSVAEVAPIGVELDVARSRGNITGRSFFDPRSDSTQDYNHVAVLLDHVYHNETGSANAIANPPCPDGGSASCFVPAQGGNDASRMWMEGGNTAWHKVRVEVEDEAGACAAGSVQVRAWIWPSGTTPAEDTFDDLTTNYTANDAGARTVTHCFPKPARSVDVGLGWQAASWDAMRVGFTVGQPGDPSNRATPYLRRFVAGSVPKWTVRPDAAAAALSSEIYNDLFMPNIGGGLAWTTILNNAGAASNNGHTSTSWISAPNLGVDIISYRGEIVITPTGSRWTHGFGVRGVGGGVGEYDVPPLDNVVTVADRQGPGTEEGLSFHFDHRYRKARVLLTKPGWPEGPFQARMVVYQSDDFAAREEYLVEGCTAGNGAQVTVEPAIAFDSLYFEPLPDGDDGSAFYVRSLRACGADVPLATCTLDQAVLGWMTTCAATVTLVPGGF